MQSRISAKYPSRWSLAMVTGKTLNNAKQNFGKMPFPMVTEKTLNNAKQNFGKIPFPMVT